MKTAFKVCPCCGEWTDDYSRKYAGSKRPATYCRPCHAEKQRRRRTGPHNADTWQQVEAAAMEQARITLEHFHKPLNALRV